MLTALIAPIAGIVVSTSVGVAIDSAVKMIVPPGIKALTGFGIKVGVAIGGGIIGSKIASVVIENINSVVETVTQQELTSAQEEN